MKMVLPETQDVGDCGGIWRETCDQTWGSFKAYRHIGKEEILRTEKDENQDTERLVNVGTRIPAKKSNLSLMRNL